MHPTDAIEALEHEWDLDSGFFGQLRRGRFDERRFSSILAVLEQVAEPNETLDARFVALTWYIPQFMRWQKERCLEHGVLESVFERATNQLGNELERILGVP